MHRCVALLRFSNITLTALKPNDIPKELNTLGDHLKKRRLTLQLFQKGISLRLGINEWTYLLWENDRCEPMIRMWPKVIEFLGYYPFPDPKILGERILAYRRHNGLSVARTAELLGVDKATLTRWESGTAPHLEAHRRALDEILARPTQLSARGAFEKGKIGRSVPGSL